MNETYASMLTMAGVFAAINNSAAQRGSGVFTKIGGRHIFWTDPSGTTHRCEGADAHSGIRLLWSVCQRDVPADAAFLPGDDDAVTCEKCAAIAKDIRP